MTATIIDGKAIGDELRREVAAGVQQRLDSGKSRPGLATVLVGENPASQVYVKSKQKACAEVGIESFGHELPRDASQAEVERLVTQLNADPAVNGWYSCLCRQGLMKKRYSAPFPSKRMWMVSTLSILAGWRKKDAIRYSFPAHLQG